MAADQFDPEAHGWKHHRFEGFAQLVGPIWSRRSEDGARFAFVAGERHLNGQGVVHGGMLVTFIDQAIGTTVYHAVDRRRCATIQLESHFVDAALDGNFVEATVEITRRTRSLVFVRGAVTCGERVLLNVQGIWKILGA